MLPGNVGRAMLGPFADARAVEQLNHELGTDRPLIEQYATWIGGFVTGDKMQKRAVELAKGVSGVKNVVDAMYVKPN